MALGDILEGSNQYGSHQWVGNMGANACDCGNDPAHTIQQHQAMRNSQPVAKQQSNGS